MGDGNHHDAPVFDVAATMYDEVLVPAFIDALAAQMTARLGPPADLVVDIGCGTGVLAPHLLAAGWQRVVGIDLSEGMLTRARARPGRVEWIAADAASLPLGDGIAGAVTSSLALMFMPDPVAVLREMGRVAQQGARVMVSTWCSLDRNPAFLAIADVLERVGGSASTGVLRRAFSMGDASDLVELGRRGGLINTQVDHVGIPARFASLNDIARTYAGPLGIGDASATGALESAFGQALAPWQDGHAVAFEIEGLILQAQGPGDP